MPVLLWLGCGAVAAGVMISVGVCVQGIAFLGFSLGGLDKVTGNASKSTDPKPEGEPSRYRKPPEQ